MKDLSKSLRASDANRSFVAQSGSVGEAGVAAAAEQLPLEGGDTGGLVDSLQQDVPPDQPLRAVERDEEGAHRRRARVERAHRVHRVDPAVAQV